MEAEVTDLSLETKTLVVNASKLRPEGGSFAIPYDYLVYAAGAQVNDWFGWDVVFYYSLSIYTIHGHLNSPS